MAVPTVAGIVEPGAVAGTDISFTVPAGVSVGDLLVAIHLHGDGQAGGGPTITLPNVDWTAKQKILDNGHVSWIHYAYVTSGGNVDASSTQTFQASASNDQTLRVLWVQGAPTSGDPFHVINGGISESLPSAETITTTVDDCLIVTAGQVDAASGHTYTHTESPTGLVQQWHFDAGASFSNLITVLWTYPLATAGSTTSTIDSTTGSEINHHLAAIAPGTSGSVYDETGAQVTIVATATAIDTLAAPEPAQVVAVATPVAVDGLTMDEPHQAVAVATVAAVDGLTMAELGAIASTSVVSATDRLAAPEPIVAVAVAAVSVADGVTMAEPHQLVVTALVSGVDLLAAVDAASVLVISEVTTPSPGGFTFSEAVQSAAVAVVSGSDTAALGEAGRLVDIASAVVGVDVGALVEQAAFAAVSTATGVDYLVAVDFGAVTILAVVTAEDVIPIGVVLVRPVATLTLEPRLAAIADTPIATVQVPPRVAALAV